MSVTYIGKISGPLWGAKEESAYTIIVSNFSINNNANNELLEDEQAIPCIGAIVPKGSEITISFAIKGATHLGLNALIGSKITTLANSESLDPALDGPFFVINNSTTREKSGWANGEATLYYGGTDWDTQTTPAAATTTAAP